MYWKPLMQSHSPQHIETYKEMVLKTDKLPGEGQDKIFGS